MRTIGTVCPVWQEHRYLPLVLEQMQLCDGPKLVIWQDKPLYWFGQGDPPSGHQSRVRDVLAQFPKIEVMKIDRAPFGEEGGFMNLSKIGATHVATQGADLVFWYDSDWLYSLNDTLQLYRDVHAGSKPRWATRARHYWRDFYHTMDDRDLYVVFSVDGVVHEPGLESELQRTEYIGYHAAYVLTDEEMYLKINSWGHAPLFKERQFFEKEWLAHDDSLVKPEPSQPPPDDVLVRLKEWGAW